MQIFLAESRWGRVVLHLVCALRDHHLRGHWQGIRRELVRQAGLPRSRFLSLRLRGIALSR